MPHSFHIPVMGTGFTIDTPLKVARYGITSVVSLVDDRLIEKMRRHYCGLYGEPYSAIEQREPDARAHRITAYLNLMNRQIARQVEELRSSPFTPDSEITRYYELMDDHSEGKQKYRLMMETADPVEKERLQAKLRSEVRAGSIDVNIMAKADRENSADGRKLPREYSDAMAALRGFAMSDLNASLVVSAGLNLPLFSYTAEFPDFHPDA